MLTRTTAFAALTLSAALALTACNAESAPVASTPAPSASASQSSTPSARKNSTDVMFTTMMIPHHQQAVEMSDTLLTKTGVDERVTKLAKAIKAAQGPEIEQMQGWLGAWGVPEPEKGMGGMGGMGHDDGMMSPEEMTALETAPGPKASKMYLTQMLAHHKGALTMAQQEIDEGKFPDAIQLAKDIKRTQTEEITTMNDILATL